MMPKLALMTARPAMRTLAIIFLLSLLTGCTTATRFTEAVEPGRSPRVVATETTETTVTFHIVQEGIGLSSVTPRVINGDVYLDTLYLSVPLPQTEFTVDLSGPQFPRDWRQRLYWIESISWPGPLVWWGRVREITRRKVPL
jgi:hypothetical protein